MGLYEPVRIFGANTGITVEADKAAYLNRRVRNQSVLHVGCSDYPITQQRLNNKTLLHAALCRNGKKVYGIDNSEEGIQILRDHGFDNVALMDAEAMNLKERYDLIVAGDVLEHMTNPGLFLARAADALEEQGTLVISVPNAFSFNVLKYAVTTGEPTHKDHTYFFSVKTLVELCRRFGFAPVALIFTSQPKDRYDSDLYIWLRTLCMKMAKTLAPAIIMEFKKQSAADKSNYFEWK